jgi:cytoskeletal protein CcmA (bactofilin family)
MKNLSLQKVNFSAAWTSLSNLLGTGLKTAEHTTAKPPQPVASQKLEASDTMKAAETKAIAKSSAPSTLKNLHPASAEITVISKDTEINGSIACRTNVRVLGSVKGDIYSDGNITISGAVEGDVTGESVTVQCGSIHGNILCKTTVSVSENSNIHGDIKCDKAHLNGDVNGNVLAQSSALLGSIAVIQGNLTTQYLSIQEGAIVDGSIKVQRDGDTAEDMFLSLKTPVAASV